MGSNTYLSGIGRLADEAYVHPVRPEIETHAKIPRLENSPGLEKPSALSAGPKNVGTKVWESLQHRAPPVLEAPSEAPLLDKLSAAASKLTSGSGPLLPVHMLKQAHSFMKREFTTVMDQRFTGTELWVDAWARDATETSRQMARDLGFHPSTTSSPTSVRTGMALFSQNDELPFAALGVLGTYMGGQGLLKKSVAGVFKVERRALPSTMMMKSIAPEQGLRTRIQEIAQLQTIILEGEKAYRAVTARADDAARDLRVAEGELRKAESEYNDTWNTRNIEKDKRLPPSQEKIDATKALQQKKETYRTAKKNHGHLMEEATQLFIRLKTLTERHQQLLALPSGKKVRG